MTNNLLKKNSPSTAPIRFRVLLVAVATVTTAAGCGGDEPLTLNQFCIDKAARECQAVALNCAATPEACKIDRVAACAAFVEQQEPRASRPFRPDRAGDCLNATAAAYSKSPITPAARRTMDEACARVFSGTKKKGDACLSTFECDGGMICDGRCATRVVVPVDEFCSNPGNVCPSGQQCIPIDTTVRQCITPNISVGMACDDDTNPCAAQLRCQSGMCMERVSQGGQCATDADCALSVPYCDPYFGNTCGVGFIPGRGARECEDFGAEPPAT